MNDHSSSSGHERQLVDAQGRPLASPAPRRWTGILTSGKAKLAGLAAGLAFLAALIANLKALTGLLPQSTRADLIVAAPDGHSIYQPLDGSVSALPHHVLAGGAKARFSLAHNHKSSDSILIDTIAFEVSKFAPGSNPAYSYKPDASKLPLHGEAKINTFRVELTDGRVASATWIRDKAVEQATAPSTNILSLPNPLVFKLTSTSDDVEWFEGTLLPTTAGAYTVTCSLGYTVAGHRATKQLEPVTIYYEH